MLSLATAYNTNWFSIAYVGWTHNGAAWEPTTSGGFEPVLSGSPEILFRNCANAPKVTELSVAVYDYTTVFTGDELANGTLVSKYEESFGADSKFATFAGTATINNVDDKVMGKGTGGTKREAQQNCAKIALSKLSKQKKR